MLRRVFLLLALVATAAMPAFAQSVAQNAAQNTDPRHIVAGGFDRATDISSCWLVKVGDDTAWASPDYDDSGWQIREKGDSITRYWKRPERRIWYRLHADVPPNTHDLAITINGIHGAFELFVNGKSLGKIGSIDGPGTFGDMVADVFHLPADIAPDGHLVIALRTAVFFTPLNFQGGISPDTLIELGSSNSLIEEKELTSFEGLASNYTNMLIAFIGSIVAFGLYFSVRAQREYLDLALSFVSTFIFAGYEIYCFAENVERTFWPTLIFSLFNILPAIFLVEFSRRLIGRSFLYLFAIFEGIMVLVQVIFPAIFTLAPAHLNSLVAGIPSGIGQIAVVTFIDFIVPIILFRAWRKGNKDAGLILLATSGSLLLNYFVLVRNLLAAIHVISGQANSPFLRVPGIVFNIAWSEVATFITSMVLLVFIILRTIRMAREKAELAGEIAAAQNVQSLLLARAARPTPGFKVETAYRPASEVGGDFFLVSPGEDGSLLAIVGDVSGKGMQAAMRVSLILGVLQRESSRAPAQVLMNLNRALLSQGEIGFTTASALLLQADGRFSFSNAGHLNPYIDGQEMPSEGALPLGLNPDIEYPTEYGHLKRGQQIVLLSDGVPEARSAAGDLYGFDKLVTLTRLGANDIAETAHIFGQTDDITVLTLALA